MRAAERIRNSKERRFNHSERERTMMPNPSEEKITAELTNDDHYEVNVSEGAYTIEPSRNQELSNLHKTMMHSDDIDASYNYDWPKHHSTMDIESDDQVSISQPAS